MSGLACWGDFWKGEGQCHPEIHTPDPSEVMSWWVCVGFARHLNIFPPHIPVSIIAHYWDIRSIYREKNTTNCLAITTNWAETWQTTLENGAPVRYTFTTKKISALILYWLYISKHMQDDRLLSLCAVLSGGRWWPTDIKACDLQICTKVFGNQTHRTVHRDTVMTWWISQFQTKSSAPLPITFF